MNETTPQLEPTEYAFHDRTTIGDNLPPYPYEGVTPSPPPPPPRRRRVGVIPIVTMAAAILGLFAGSSYFAVSHYSGNAPIYAGKNGNITNLPPISPVAAKSVPTKVVPTVTQTTIQAVPYTAVEVWDQFNNAGIDMTNYRVDHDWCNWTARKCQWIPSGGAVYWDAIESGAIPTLEVATFLNPQHAVDDAAVFESNGNVDWTQGNCLLIDYNPDASSLPDLQPYLNVMSQFCR